jgi:hypothetical protein
MRRSISIVALLLIVGVAPIHAQLAITSRITAESTSSPKPRTPLPDILPMILLGVEARFTKLTVEVRTYVGADSVRVEGMGPLIGYAADAVLIVRADGTGTWFDPVARTYFVAAPLPDGLALKALSLTKGIKTKPEGEETLLGRRAAGTRTEIAIKLPEDPETYRTYHDSMLGRPVNLDDTSRVKSGSGLPGSSIPATMDAWLRLSVLPRDLKIVVRTWETTEFGADGLSAARTGALAEMSRTFSLAPAGLPLRQIVQTSSSNGVGYRWETQVLHVSREAIPAERFEVPQGLALVRMPFNFNPR